MNSDHVTTFFEKAKADRELRDKVTEIFRGSSESQPEALSRLSTEVGTPFTVQELLDHASKTKPLADDELEHVSGGAGVAHREEMWAQDVAAAMNHYREK